MANNVPQIGVTGLYTLTAPFDAQLLPNVAYRCAAVRRLEDIIAAGGDPKALYYTPNNLSDAQYQQDVQASVCIISLQASNGSWVYVPSSYIASMPDQGGVPYTTVVLAVSLSAVPDWLDLSYVKQQIHDVVLDNIGVDSAVKSVQVSPTTHLSQSESQSLEAARQAKVTNSTTDRAQLLAVTAQRDAALTKISQLEAYIKAKFGGSAEVDNLTINAAPTVAGNVSFVVDGVTYTVALDPTVDTTAAAVATKIAAVAVPNWTLSISGADVTFTANAVGVKTPVSYTDTGTTGATGTVVQTHAGTNSSL